ncbi:hypothetical protein L6452_11087 [Arctium lappa]|uniref:Uncharacterized protein n=1 Tax=Arctium lappa TaxID=4217 RepID=A0ACB9DNQ9_ARCLA|nr:hypothetical protein L6452_11087 [Arctium lappa]
MKGSSHENRTWRFSSNNITSGPFGGPAFSFCLIPFTTFSISLLHRISNSLIPKLYFSNPQSISVSTLVLCRLLQQFHKRSSFRSYQIIKKVRF